MSSTNYYLHNILLLSLIVILIYIISADESYEISNITIIDSKWLNYFITIGLNNDAYVNIDTFSNGDLVVQTSELPKSNARKFFGITTNGKPLFNNGKYFASIQTTTSGFDMTTNIDYDPILEDSSIVIYND